MVKVLRADHLALRVKDVAASVKFYCEWASMHIVHERKEHEHKVSWVRLPDDSSAFILVLIEDPTFVASGRSSVDHLGLHVAGRAEVDAVARRAEREGILVEKAQYAGPIAGYLCCIRDPDGNVIEFSCEQMKT
jgi:catechol 2,3-dioxygenase-like lactoylglutathione lyase family enzyme